MTKKKRKLERQLTRKHWVDRNPNKTKRETAFGLSFVLLSRR